MQRNCTKCGRYMSSYTKECFGGASVAYVCPCGYSQKKRRTWGLLKETTVKGKKSTGILRDASILHEDLRNYGNLLDVEKPLIVSGILLALQESEYGNFSVDDLTGDPVKTDGRKIYDAINKNLHRANVPPEVEKDKIISQFVFIRDTVKVN